MSSSTARESGVLGGVSVLIDSSSLGTTTTSSTARESGVLAVNSNTEDELDRDDDWKRDDEPEGVVK